MILCSLSGPLRYCFTIAILPIEKIFHRCGGNQQDKLCIYILCNDLPNCTGQLRARCGLVGQNEIAWHGTPPEKLWTDNRRNRLNDVPNTRPFFVVFFRADKCKMQNRKPLFIRKSSKPQGTRRESAS